MEQSCLRVDARRPMTTKTNLLFRLLLLQCATAASCNLSHAARSLAFTTPRRNPSLFHYRFVLLTAINGTVHHDAGEDRIDGLGQLSRHGKQFM